MEQGTFISSFMKVGWSGENFPDIVFPTLMGRPMIRANEKSSAQIKVPL